MEKIIRDYAIIYIDRTGESLKCDNFTPNEIIEDYFNNPGFLQWNYYLIIDYDVIKTKNIVDNILLDDKYTKKYISNNIDKFIEQRFPLFNENNYGKIKLIKGNSWFDAKEKTKKYLNENIENKFKIVKSWHRNLSLNDSLENMDILRSTLINNTLSKDYVFYTHISNEMSLAEKKFKLMEIK